MGQFADKVEISPLSTSPLIPDKDLFKTGQFCLNCTKDCSPVSIAKAPMDAQALSETLLLNTQSVLHAIDEIIQQADITPSHGNQDINVQILKHIIPQLRASYHREDQRLTTAKTEHHKIWLAIGINAIYYCINDDAINNNTLEWSVINQSDSGMLIRSDSKNYPDIHIGDFLGVFESNLPAKLAIVRWLYTDSDHIISIGLEFQLGQAMAVTCLPYGENSSILSILLPGVNDSRQLDTLITEKGVFSPNRILQIKNNHKSFSVTIETLISSSFNYEQFSYNVDEDSKQDSSAEWYENENDNKIDNDSNTGGIRFS